MATIGFPEGRAFAPDDMQVLRTSFEAVVARLGLDTPEPRERAAKLLVALASDRTELEADDLTQAALALLTAPPPVASRPAPQPSALA